jgi:divalent anion:Na+ symporter, DASS family
LVLWMTERQHGISSAIVAMLGVCALMGLKVMGVKEFRAKVNWDILIYIGCMYEIGSALTTWGITKWIGGVLGPVLNPFLSNPVLFVLIFILLVYLTRFIVISWLGVMTVYSVLLAPLAVQAGMHPFIPCFIAYVSVNVFFFDFQNLPYVSAIGIVGDMVDHNKNCVPYAIIWAAANLVACLISVPYWKMIGML